MQRLIIVLVILGFIAFVYQGLALSSRDAGLESPSPGAALSSRDAGLESPPRAR